MRKKKKQHEPPAEENNIISGSENEEVDKAVDEITHETLDKITESIPDLEMNDNSNYPNEETSSRSEINCENKEHSPESPKQSLYDSDNQVHPRKKSRRFKPLIVAVCCIGLVLFGAFIGAGINQLSNRGSHHRDIRFKGMHHREEQYCKAHNCYKMSYSKAAFDKTPVIVGKEVYKSKPDKRYDQKDATPAPVEITENANRAEMGVTVGIREIENQVEIYILSVNRGGAASIAGVEVDDVILSANNITITSIDTLREIVNDLSPGDTVSLKVYRAGQELIFTVILDEASVLRDARPHGRRRLDLTEEGVWQWDGTLPFDIEDIPYYIENIPEELWGLFREFIERYSNEN